MRKSRNTIAAVSMVPDASSPGNGDNLPLPSINEFPHLPEIERGDLLIGGPAIHEFVVGLLGVSQTLSTTYFQAKHGIIPTKRFGSHLVASRKGIARSLASGLGLDGQADRVGSDSYPRRRKLKVARDPQSAAKKPGTGKIHNGKAQAKSAP